ncbi:MAG TPA: PepSY domain-containing protein [Steroidobacteraceae bacterium]|nr:PepSY domain-containing protein [Steroidobacteraceae bacterium]
MNVWRLIRYWLYVGHRWLGIFACALFAMWFASGIVMTVIGFPTLDETARQQALRPIDWTRVAVTPNQLLAALPLERYPRELALEMLLDKPVYRVRDWDGSRRTISAERIENVGETDVPAATNVASDYANAPAQLIATIDQDQWTVPEGYIALRPLHKLAIDDAAGTQVYVSGASGEVVLATTRTQRFWNWLGAVPHWIYFTELRANQPVWRQVNLWASGPAILVAVSGIWIGVLRIRVRSRHAHRVAADEPSATMSPYHGWKLWHHWLGLIGGVFLLTWIVSGWLSVNPNQWFSGGWPTPLQWLQYSGHRGLTYEANLLAIARPDTKRVIFYYVAGEPVARVIYSAGESIVDARTGKSIEFSDRQLFAAMAKVLPKHEVLTRERLIEDDLHWYSHHDQRRLPVLRTTFDDPSHSWFYVDPKSGEIVDFSDDKSRRYRWWFNAIHRWDLTPLIQNRPLWYTLIWTFASAGLALSISGVVIGWRRVKRKAIQIHNSRHKDDHRLDAEESLKRTR